MLYRILKIILGIAIRFYYSEIRVKNKDRLRHSGAKIIIANHPNTLMDAWILGQLFKEPIYFMTKGTFFNKKWKRVLLKKLGLIPINRPIDKRTSGVSNYASFELCYQLLEEGKTLVVFPEGNSMLERQLRELKSGAARIALEILNRGKLKKITIIPMGIIYTRGEKFQSSVLSYVGEPIDPFPYLEEYQSNPIQASRHLTDVFRVELEKLLVGSKSREQDELVDEIIEVLATKELEASEDKLESRVELVRKTHQALNAIYAHEPWKIERVQQLTQSIKWRLDKLDINANFIDKKYKVKRFLIHFFENFLFIIIGFPIFSFGFFHNFIPFQFTNLIMPYLVKNIEYYAPIAILIGIVAYPITYVSFLFLGDYYLGVEGWCKFIYFTLMPITGLFAYYFVQKMQRTVFRLNYMIIYQSDKDKIYALKADREVLYNLLFQ